MGGKETQKCFSGILNRLLCSGGLPAQTHPSERLTESSIEKLGDQKPEKCVKPVNDDIKQVGVVARLMGLESFPCRNTKDRTLGDFFRSKSVNSIDFLSHFDPVKNGHYHHRRVRTSVSFRDNDLTSIILRLDEEKEEEDEEEEVEEESLRRKNREYFQGRKVCNKPGKNLEKMKSKISPGAGPGNSTNQKKDLQGKTGKILKERRAVMKREKCKEAELVESKCVKNKKKKMNLAHKGNCKNKIHPEGTVPEIARGPSPRKYRPAQTAKNPNSSNFEASPTIIKSKNDDRRIKSKESCYYKRMVEEICRVTEADLKEKWNHGMLLKFEDIEEICQHFGQQILQDLIKQFVDELVIHFGHGISVDCI